MVYPKLSITLMAGSYMPVTSSEQVISGKMPMYAPAVEPTKVKVTQ